jgi:hypothetical protein
MLGKGQAQYPQASRNELVCYNTLPVESIQIQPYVGLLNMQLNMQVTRCIKSTDKKVPTHQALII